MPLDTPGLKAAIIAAQQASSGAQNPTEAREQFAESLAQAIEVFVKTGTVTTTGSASAQTGTIA